MIKKIIVIIIIVIIIFGGGIYTGYNYKNKYPDKIYIKDESKTVYKYIKSAKKYDELKDSYDSRIEINGTIKPNNILRVTASDSYKESTKDFYLGSRGNWKFYVAGGIVIAVVGGITGWQIHKKYR